MSLSDSWQQVFAGAHARPAEWCKGCGYWAVVNGRCRDDCTAHPPAEKVSADLHYLSLVPDRAMTARRDTPNAATVFAHT